MDSRRSAATRRADPDSQASCTWRNAKGEGSGRCVRQRWTIRSVISPLVYANHATGNSKSEPLCSGFHRSVHPTGRQIVQPRQSALPSHSAQRGGDRPVKRNHGRTRQPLNEKWSASPAGMRTKSRRNPPWRAVDLIATETIVSRWPTGICFQSKRRLAERQRTFRQGVAGRPNPPGRDRTAGAIDDQPRPRPPNHSLFKELAEQP